ncbi:hemolysin secretion protein D [Rhizobium sp. Leaf306]|nr:hemolysin secretion protein D [Rhizobium sp. Leaf306]
MKPNLPARSRKHVQSAIFATLATFCSATATLGQDMAAPPPVTVAKPLVRDVTEQDDFIGRFQAVEEVLVRARVGGYLDKVQFTDGSLVKSGDPLFVIDQRPFKTALEQATSALEVAKSTLTYAGAQFHRAEALSANGSQSISVLDDRRREWLSAQANVRGAKASADRAQLDLDYTQITAPLSGRIDRHMISPGNLVQADQTELTTIVSLDPIDFYFDVDERRLLSYAALARENGQSLQEGGGGLNVTATIADGSSKPFHGKLNFSENKVDSQSGTMRVRARFPNPDLVLQPGLFGRIEVGASKSYTAILVPDEALSADQNQRVVYVVGPDGTVTTKAVRTGPKLYGYRVIREGLKGDETVVVNGLMRARPGQKVTPKMTQLPQEALVAGAVQ